MNLTHNRFRVGVYVVTMTTLRLTISYLPIILPEMYLCNCIILDKKNNFVVISNYLLFFFKF